MSARDWVVALLFALVYGPLSAAISHDIGPGAALAADFVIFAPLLIVSWHLFGSR